MCEFADLPIPTVPFLCEVLTQGSLVVGRLTALAQLTCTMRKPALATESAETTPREIRTHCGFEQLVTVPVGGPT